MYVCMYVCCMYVYFNEWMSVRVLVRLGFDGLINCMYVYMYECMYVCTCVFVCTLCTVCTYVHVCMHASMYVWTTYLHLEQFASGGTHAPRVDLTL